MVTPALKFDPTYSPVVVGILMIFFNIMLMVIKEGNMEIYQ